MWRLTSVPVSLAKGQNHIRPCPIYLLTLAPLPSAGVKVNAPVRSLITTLSAADPDLRPAPVRYVLDDVTFSRHVRATEREEMRSELGAFVVDETSGQLWTNEGMAKYSPL